MAKKGMLRVCVKYITTVVMQVGGEDARWSGGCSPANQLRNPRVMQGCGRIEPLGRERKGEEEDSRGTGGGTMGNREGH
jgi:hypothetical protein